jgi:hypothetical protein
VRGSRRRRRDAATDASLLLVQDALVQIRAMACRRRDLGAGDGEDSSGDYHERIRLIADACEAAVLRGAGQAVARVAAEQERPQAGPAEGPAGGHTGDDRSSGRGAHL